MNVILKFWRHVSLGFSFAIGLGDGLAQPNSDLMKFAEPPTVESLVTIDSVRIDGSLALRFDLGAMLLGPGANFPFHLEHRLETDYGRATRSAWDIPELYGVIAPAGRETLRWRLFGLGEVIVPAVPPGPTYYPVGMGYAMQRSAWGDFSFRNALGWEWLYRDWTLVMGRGPNGLQLDFQVQGGRISVVTATRYRIAAGNIEAVYDDAGRVHRLRIGERVHEFQYEGDSFRLNVLTSINETQTSVVRFSYVNELLSGVQDGEAPARTLDWGEVPNGKRSDCKWPNSVGVGRTNHCLLKYDHGTQGYVISCQPIEAGPLKRVTLNNRKGVATIEENGAVVRRMAFGTIRGKPDAGQLTQIADGDGKVLERYEYNDQGRVAHAWLEKGERIDYRYDQTGALIGALKMVETNTR